MASSNHNVELPLTPRPWWEVFIGSNRNQDLSTVCNSILALGDEKDLDIRRSKYAFVPSLMDKPSFNDPDSYLWSMAGWGWLRTYWWMEKVLSMYSHCCKYFTSVDARQWFASCSAKQYAHLHSSPILLLSTIVLWYVTEDKNLRGRKRKQKASVNLLHLYLTF